MTARFRFGVWIACIAVQLATLPLSLDLARLSGTDFESFHSKVAIIAMTAAVIVFGLILTTPSDAIRLKPTLSFRCITAGTVWLVANQVLQEDSSRLGVLGGAAELLATVWLVLALQRVRFTPWLATCFVWTPAFIGPLAMPTFVGAFVIAFVALVVKWIPPVPTPGELTP